MAFSIDQFRNQLSGDGARPNLFEIELNFPVFAAQSDANRKISFMCNSAQLPGSILGVTPTFYFGREVKLAGNRTYPEWTINIINDESFNIRNSFERWVNGINDPILNVRNPVARTVDIGYGVNAKVKQYSKAGAIIKTYDFIGMFPIDVSPIEVNWSANDQIEEFSVTLAYQYHLSAQNGGTSGVASRLFS